MRALLFLLFISLNGNIYSQNFVIDPYLQNATTDQMTIMWEVDDAGDCMVNWGNDPFTLTNSEASTTTATDGNNLLHTAIIDGLSVHTKYYYRVTTKSGQVSKLKHFKTLPDKDSEENVNFVAMSDMQIDGSNPNVFNTIIDEGVMKIVDTYTNGVEDLDGVVIPGDLVSSASYNSWRNTFFGPSDSLSSVVPVYPVPGNHEYLGAGLPQFLQFFNLPLNGSASNPEEWWFKDISNVRLIGLNSNSPSAEMTVQLTWLETVLSEAGNDDDIDFVFAQLHHPYLSELWTPGERDFSGDVIEKLENFTTTFEKPSIHFFGHTHGYSRGQSRDHNHLWLNVATAGGAIDNWGEFPNADYDEFSISEDEYGFVMLEVEAGADPKFVMKRYSHGDSNNFEDNTLADEITIKRYGQVPDKPVGESPEGELPINCITLEASDFVSNESTHQASQWQVAENCDFTSTNIVDIWKQSENWYNEINTQANDDLTDQSVVSLEAGKSYCWRVRYRDAGLKWSDWSEPLSFTTLSSDGVATENLLLNFDAENGTTNWTGDIETLISDECGSVPVYEGNNMFAVGGVCANEQNIGIARQEINLAAYQLDINEGKYNVEFSGYLRSFVNGNDTPEMYIEFLNNINEVISISESVSSSTSIWTNSIGYAIVPLGATKLNMVLKGTRNTGSDNDSYFDLLSLKLVYSECNAIVPSCGDGVQNGQETGTDCGGPDCDPCTFGTWGNKHVLVIGIDGMRTDAIQFGSTPNIDELIDNGAVTYDATAGGILGTASQQITSSGPGWSSILSGVWTDKHGVTDNSFSGQNFAQYPHFFSRLYEVNSEAQLSSIINWGPINQNILNNSANSNEFFATTHGSDIDVTTAAVDHLANADPDVLFVHLDEMDGAGHSSGFSISNANYITEMEDIDGQIGQLVNAVEARTNYNQEDWLIIIVTDHGGTPGGSHGGQSYGERRISLIVSGGEAVNQELFPGPGHHAVPATALYHLGVDIDPSWGWDGAAFGFIPDYKTLETDLIGCYGLDGNVNDNTDMQNTGVMSGGPTYSAGKIGQGLSFDGVDDYVTIGGTGYEFGSDQDFSLAVWVKNLNGGSDADGVVISNKDWDSGSNVGYVISDGTSNPNSWQWNIGDSNGRSDYEGQENGIGDTDDVWHHIAISHDRNDYAVMYLDGNIVGASDIHTILNQNSSLPTVLGADGTLVDYFLNGNIDEVSVWNRRISETEVKELYNMGNQSISLCAPGPRCTDGIQNGNETGIDCGGDCDACGPCLVLFDNNWIGPSNGIWNEPSNWDRGSVPRYCDKVIIGDGNIVTLEDGIFGKAYSVLLEGNAQLLIEDAGDLDVKITN